MSDGAGRRGLVALAVILAGQWLGSHAAFLGACRAAEGAAEKVGGKILRAGAAASNITPPLGLPIVGNWNSPPAQNVHDELHARCLVLDDGTTKIGLVICDSVGIPREVFDAARELIAAETDLPPQNVLMAATHTHSAVSAGGRGSKTKAGAEFDDYQKFLIRRIADGVRRALSQLEPARIGWGGVDEPSELFNRRWYLTDSALMKNPFGEVDQVRMNPPAGNAALVRPAGPVDPEISFISVQAAGGRPIALLANYSLHYVGGIKPNDISADYFGAFAGYIAENLRAEKLDPPFVGILSNGTSGDVNNINFKGGGSGERKQPYEKMHAVARLVAGRVTEAQRSIAMHDWVPLGSARQELSLKVRKPDEAQARYLASVMAKPDSEAKYHPYERIYAERIQKLVDGPDEISIVLQALRIGDLGVASIPFEVFTEIGLAIKANSPFADTFTIELANGSYGYLPTPEQHKLGGYETWMGTNNVQLDASERIAEVLLKLLKELKR